VGPTGMDENVKFSLTIAGKPIKIGITGVSIKLVYSRLM
jgi:hypothetical protein